MNKEDIIKEINNGEIKEGFYPERSDCCDLADQVFENITLDNIECYRATFENCTFKNVQFINNKIEWIEFSECRFEDTIFSGKCENILLTIMDSSFERCQIKDFDFTGFSQQSEICTCTFDNCTFENIKIEADLSLSGGSVTNSQGIDISGKMNIIFDVDFKNDRFENIDMDTTIMKNTLSDVQLVNVNSENVVRM